MSIKPLADNLSIKVWICQLAFIPPRLSSLFRNFLSPFWRHVRRTFLLACAHDPRPRREDIDHELGELVCIAGALLAWAKSIFVPILCADWTLVCGTLQSALDRIHKVLTSALNLARFHHVRPNGIGHSLSVRVFQIDQYVAVNVAGPDCARLKQGPSCLGSKSC
jgi:hypothetical protein